MGRGEDVGRLGHEVHAAKDDEVGVAAVGREPRQPEAVAAGVRPAHHLVLLVVVPEDQEPPAEGVLRHPDARGELVGRKADREHRARRGALHRTPAQRNQT